MSLKIGKSYMELCTEIKFWINRKESIKSQIEFLMNRNKPRELRGIDYTRPKVQNGNAILDFEESLINIAPMEKEVEKIDVLITGMEERKKEIEDGLKNADGIDYNILYKKYVEGKTLKIIAEELSYSHSYMRHKIAKLKI